MATVNSKINSKLACVMLCYINLIEEILKERIKYVSHIQTRSEQD